MVNLQRIPVTLTLLLCVSSFALNACGNGNDNSPVAAPGQTPAPKVTVTVEIPAGAMGRGSAAFGTNPLVIAAGTTITWINRDSMPHTTTSSTGVWDSGLLQPGQSFSFQFSSGGDFPYLCSIHGAMSMSGMIHVTGPVTQPTPAPTPTPLSPTYTTVTNTILVPHCMSCHEGPAPSAGLDFTTWQNLVHNPVLPTLVVAGSPAQSALFTHIQGGAPVGDQEHLTAEQIQLVSDWIQSGAPDN